MSPLGPACEHFGRPIAHDRLSDSSTFHDRFLELTGFAPFPWQERLYGRFLEGRMPGRIDLPTGLGKTSVLAIWKIARESGADVPRRLVYIVDRRTIVDQVSEEATKLAQRRPELSVCTLRGQLEGREDLGWLVDPSREAVIVGTLDMIGSRLLFAGYGVSGRMRPCHAGVLGVDSLIVLDEAHLIEPFAALLREVRGAGAWWPDPAIRPFKLITMSATHGAAEEGDVFGLADADLAHPVCRRRLEASKALTIETTDEADFSERMAQHAIDLALEHGPGARIAVFCDLREESEARELSKIGAGGNDGDEGGGGVTATKRALPACYAKSVHEALTRRCKAHPALHGARIELLTGARRAHEKAAVRSTLAACGFLPGGTRVDEPAFLIATSAGEVGMDLDSDHMVCDLVAWGRMVQRFGRVNRRGSGESRAVVLAPAPKCWPPTLVGTRVDECVMKREALEILRGLEEVCPLTLLGVRATRGEEILRPPLGDAVLEALTMTSFRRNPARPKVGPWLRGWRLELPQVRIAWRAHLPPEGIAEEFFALAPVLASEILETEQYRAKQWLAKRLALLLKKADGTEEALDRPIAYRLADGAAELVRLSDFLSRFKGALRVEDRALDRIVAPGLLVVDAAAVAGLDVTTGLLDAAVSTAPSTADTDPSWRSGFAVSRAHARKRGAVCFLLDAEASEWLIVQVDPSRVEEARAIATRPQSLEAHQACARERTESIVARLGLADSPLGKVICEAAARHDDGKAAQRWQCAFSAEGPEVMGKTQGPVDLVRLAGYRHELGSVLRYVRRGAAEEPLLLHLIAAHHGGARPVLCTDGVDDFDFQTVQRVAGEVCDAFDVLQRRYGPWGLAWLETLVRAADWQASALIEQVAA